MRTLLVLVALSVCLSAVHADIYFQSPRGSNNRLDEARRDRNNGNRLFDSQNNNRGGYNVGSVYYHHGSIVPFEWTAQHSCGSPNNRCEFIVQYMCDDLLRDGTTTKTIPTKRTQCAEFDCDTDLEYGRHESWDWYMHCDYRVRNKGLFTANQKLRAHSARYTRQNPAGTRRGYECPEERDYYPYWHPTPWKDIAILTNDPSRCDAYLAESQNVKSRWSCWLDEAHIAYLKGRYTRAFIPITQPECEALEWFDEAANKTHVGRWVETPSWGLAAPECRENVWQRDNHHGNVEGGFPVAYNWTVPYDITHEHCAFRIRYNITTDDYDAWLSDEAITAGVGYNESTVPGPNNANTVPAKLDVWSKYGITYSEVEASFTNPNRNDLTQKDESRDYVFKNNPRVDIFGQMFGPTNSEFRFKLQLAINTNQFGRTFQDRTHRFAVRPRPSDIPDDAIIHNLQVKGKRGNIVQTFPAHEYDFTPNRLEVGQGDYIHIQWTGSNTNPNNNAGQGKQGTDRHNMVMQRPRNYFEPGQELDRLDQWGQWGNSYPTRDIMSPETPFIDLGREDLINLAILKNQQFGGEMSELDDAGTYFDLGPRRVSTLGIYHYLCTRNNNFSNRSQKGKIVVRESSAVTSAIGVRGGTVDGGGVRLTVPPGAVQGVTSISIIRVPSGSTLGKQAGVSGARSDFYIVSPSDIIFSQPAEFSMDYSLSPLYKGHVERADTLESDDWTIIDADMGNMATVKAKRGGAYVIRQELDGAIVAAIVVSVVAAIGLAVAAWKYISYRRNQKLEDTLPLAKIG